MAVCGVLVADDLTVLFGIQPRNFMVMIDGAMAFTPKDAIQGKTLWSFDQDWDECSCSCGRRQEKKLRFGIFPRSQKLTTET